MSEQEERERYRYLQLKAKASQQSGDTEEFGSQAMPSGNSPMLDVASEAFRSATMGPYDATKAMVENPEELAKQLPVIGAVGGELVAGPPGAAVGAGLGQIGKRMAGIAYGTEEPSRGPIQEAIAPMVQTAAGGIPGLSGVFSPGKKTLSEAVMSGLAKTGQTLSGAKKETLEQATQQGYSTYFAPSLSKAQDIFGKAVGPEGQAAMKSSVDQAFDPALGQARAKAVEIGTKLEKGEPITALEALQARQATDRVISSTPAKDKLARRALYDWRKQFDDVMTSQSGPMKEASTLYRQAIVKDQLLSPTRLNKGGEPSAFLPMILGAAGIGGVGSGHGRKTAGAVGAGLAATSPLAWGFGATTMGMISPTARQALISKLVDKVFENRRNGGR